MELSKLSPTDPRHVCGTYCDGQDGSGSFCTMVQGNEQQKNYSYVFFDNNHLVNFAEGLDEARKCCRQLGRTLYTTKIEVIAPNIEFIRYYEPLSVSVHS